MYKLMRLIILASLTVGLLAACADHSIPPDTFESVDSSEISTGDSVHTSEEPINISWGDLSANLYSKESTDIAIKVQFLDHGEILDITPFTLDKAEIQYLDDLQELLPQNPPEKVDFNQPGIVLTITDSGEEYSYLIMSDNSIFTFQHGKAYCLGDSSSTLSFRRQLDHLIMLAKEKQPELISLKFPEDDMLSFDSKDSATISISPDAEIFMCLWDWSENPQFLTIHNADYTAKIIEALNSVSEIKPFEYKTGGMILYLIIEENEELEYYMFRGPKELFDYQNNVIWNVPDTLFDRCLFVYAQELIKIA